jgi:hypothetical protein
MPSLGALIVPYVFAAALTTIPTQSLVLKNGVRMPVDNGSVTDDGGKVIFRSGGALYSLPSAEVDFEATRAASSTVVVTPEDDGNRLRIKVSEAEKQRLLREIEQNHKGAGLPPVQAPAPPPVAATTPAIKPQPKPSEKAESEEWKWRRESRAHQEAVRQAKEELQLLNDRIETLRGQIRNFVALGYKPKQFTYQTTELQYALDAIPAAELAVKRAERAYEQFRDDARRLGVLPGWLI